MATPMHVYHELAARYGNVDPGDYDAVEEFFITGKHKLSLDTQLAISEELLARDGEPEKPMKRRTNYGKKPVELPKLSEVTPVVYDKSKIDSIIK